MKIAAVILIVLGVLGLAYGGCCRARQNANF